MQTYTLISVEETIIYLETGGSITESRQYPIDLNGNLVLDYMTKNRVIRGEEMIVFDSKSEYQDWLRNNQ